MTQKKKTYKTSRGSGNGSGGIIDNDSANLTRDVTALFSQYGALRHALYKEFKGYQPNSASREDLVSFINEQFVRLCYEYDPSGEVDFAGYMKIMLKMRVQYSFINREYIVREREPLLAGMHSQSSEEWVHDEGEETKVSGLQFEFVDFITTNANLTDIEYDVLTMLIDLKTSPQMEQMLLDKYGSDVSKTSIRRTVRAVREYVKVSIEEWGKQS